MQVFIRAYLLLLSSSSNKRSEHKYFAIFVLARTGLTIYPEFEVPLFLTSQKSRFKLQLRRIDIYTLKYLLGTPTVTQ